MLRTSYKHLNTVQKGSFAEAFAKMAFTLEGFEVYTTDYDDRGIDFVIRNDSGRFFSVQVKATGQSVNPFIYEEKFTASSDFLLCAVRLVEGISPEIYLVSGADWNQGNECLHFNPGGGSAGPYFELRFSKRYSKNLDRHRFEHYVSELRGSSTDGNPKIEQIGGLNGMG